MPSVLLEDSIIVELEAKEPWPLPIKLFQPYEVEQILLPDNANCLAVQALLKFCGLEFQIEPRSNAEYMSPSGRVPFIKCGSFIISEFDNIVSYLATKGTSLSDHLSFTTKADMRAYISLVNNVFVNAELYICWVDKATLETVTKLRHGSVYPWPLNHFLNWQKRKEVVKKLNVIGWYNRTMDDICTDVENCCSALSERLGNNEYFSGEKPTEFDAVVYGHLYAFTNSHKTSFPSSIQRIITTILRYPRLIGHMHRVDRYFNRSTSPSLKDFEVIESPSKDTLWNFSESLESLPPLSEESFML